MAVSYEDGRISVGSDTLSIGGYYFPWGGAKRIPLSAIRSVTRVAMTPTRGKARIWGTANPGYWANFDARRPSKDVGFVVDAGRRMKPLVTPDDPDAFAATLQAAGIAVADEGGPGPVV